MKSLHCSQQLTRGTHNYVQMKDKITDRGGAGDLELKPAIAFAARQQA